MVRYSFTVWLFHSLSTPVHPNAANLFLAEIFLFFCSKQQICNRCLAELLLAVGVVVRCCLPCGYVDIVPQLAYTCTVNQTGLPLTSTDRQRIRLSK
jgi:hypothetical protein